ncbi:helix-turn-helix domain-containing protein [Morganella morganii]|uniref:helix-turn-helix domain-containing protein n=1 Tax=Morganella morganii TaxID=582 RepID=UPI00197C4630|nr:helix-turn-helix transcriptional regulator [Morganella morganii]
MSKLIHDDLTLSLSLYIGSLLRKTRVENGLAGRELAELVNVSQQQISRYERGTTSVDIRKLFQLLLALNMNADEVMDFFYKIVVEAGFTPEFISKNSYAECVCNLNNN